MFEFGVLTQRGSSCKSSFRNLVDPSTVVRSVFDILWRLKILKKVRFFVWLGRVHTMDKVLRKFSLLTKPFCCILYRKAKENLDHFLLEG